MEKTKRIAVCYWGLPRSIGMVYQSQKEKVFDVLTSHGIEYDVYAHFWQTDVNRVWDWVVPMPLDYDSVKLLNPKSVQIDDQQAFLDTIKFEEYYYEHEKDQEWLPHLIRNHLCALESQKRCVNLCLSANVAYDYIMFLRPDALIESFLPVELVFGREEKAVNTIVLPTNNHYEGLNDRFAILRFESVLWYSHRINRIREFRKHNGRIVSEKYVKYVVDGHYLPEYVDFNFRLMRTDGSIM
jgi:hypothetical protein